VSTKPLEDTLNAVAAIADVTQPRSPSAATAISAAASAAVNAADGTTAANLQLADNALQLSLSAAHPLDATAAAAAAAATAAAAKAEAAAARTAVTSDAEPASDDATAAAAAAAAAEQAQTAAALAADWAQYVEALAERHKPRRAALQKALLSHCGADLQALAHTLALQQQQQPASDNSSSSSDNSSSSSDSSSEQDAAAVAVAAAEAAAAAQQRVLAWAVEKRGGWRGAVLLDTGDVDVEADVTIWPQRDQASFVCCAKRYNSLLCCERQCRALSTVHEHYNICVAGIACIEQYCSDAVLHFAVVGITLQCWTVSLHANTFEHSVNCIPMATCTGGHAANNQERSDSTAAATKLKHHCCHYCYHCYYQ
jgi:hypothetical protein